MRMIRQQLSFCFILDFVTQAMVLIVIFVFFVFFVFFVLSKMTQSTAWTLLFELLLYSIH